MMSKGRWVDIVALGVGALIGVLWLARTPAHGEASQRRPFPSDKGSAPLDVAEWAGDPLEVSGVSPKLLSEHINRCWRGEANMKFSEGMEIKGQHTDDTDTFGLEVLFRPSPDEGADMIRLLEGYLVSVKPPSRGEPWRKERKEKGGLRESADHLGQRFEKGTKWWKWTAEKSMGSLFFDPSSGWCFYEFDFDDLGI